MNIRKYPRTMQEAFGPYTSSRIDEPVRPLDRADTIVLVGCACIAIAFALVMVLA